MYPPIEISEAATRTQPRRPRAAISTVLLAMLCILLAIGASGQILSQPHMQSPPPPPRTALYRYFFALQSRLDQEADRRQKQGKDVGWLRNHLQQKLGFDDAEINLVRETGARVNSQMRDIDARVKAWVRADRIQNPRTASSGTPRPLPPEIKAFTEERDAVIEREVARLKESLSPEHAQKLENFVLTEFTKATPASHAGPAFRQKPPEPARQEVRP